MSHPEATVPPRQEHTLPAEYSLPTSGVLSYVPKSWVPYGELARVDKPTGILHFYFPHLFGTLYAACIIGSAVRLNELLYTNLVLLIGTFFFRSAACAWNDNLDREYDRQVPRCRLRPLARGALSPTQGYVYTIILAVFALYFIYILPKTCWLTSVPNVILATFYPFAKRFTDFPQAVLGFQQALGLFIGAGTIMTNPEKSPDFENKPNATEHLWAVGALYLAIVCWEMIVDMVYAQQDVEYDAKAGVRSMAVHFRNSAKALLWAISLLQTLFLVATGVWAGFGRGYMAISCGGVISALAYMLGTINLSVPHECAWFFKVGHWFVNLAMAGGLLVQSNVLYAILPASA
ncbi:putative para-hydroxybenzoate-polyprenyltransferase-like protein [Rosellinia necatrix]|uniref:Diterpenoid pyrone biosynthesis cluster protein C n=1 Tax=Rosellinia necatrix TaxID=77044 RepID=A0A1W2TSZ7_ROSNE|nr:putative para-hydroxybenzoate-polyprenyltransferase-like protein [Rosellinia necatrix]